MTKITPETLTLALIEYLPKPWSHITSMHFAVASLYDPEKGYAACTQEELADELMITSRTIRSCKKELAASGLWTMERGRNGVPSTYKPSKKLRALVRRAAR